MYKNQPNNSGIFSKCKQLPETYSKEATYLYKKYRPIEINPNLSIETKVEAMNEWMIASENLIKGVPFKAQEIMEVAKIYGTDLRNGTKELLEKLNSKQIPVLVFSAGLGDIVEAILMQNHILFDNVKIISNFLKYENEKLAGFENERKIHVFNKNEHAIEQNYFKLLEGRKNVFLMGDNIGDAFMVDGMTNTHAVLKIGFLYDNVENCLPFYLEVFDIVLVDDQTMEVPASILQQLL